ncbi:MAG: ABC transporter permease [Alphaproteobacteria bacterium]
MFDEAIHGFQVQCRVIRAILLREIRTRFGNYYLGYLWALIVPLLFVIALTVFFTVLGRSSRNGVPIELFIFTGLMAWLTFNDTQGHAARAFAGNRPLLVYPMVTVIDIVIARTLLEFGTKICATVILAALFFAVGVDVTVQDPLGIVLAMSAMAYLAACFGHIIGCILVIVPSANFIVTASRRLLFFTSGVFFLVTDLPETVREYILYNPLAHVINFARSAWIPGYPSDHSDPMYVLGWIIGLSALAAVSEKLVENRRSGAMQ